MSDKKSLGADENVSVLILIGSACFHLFYLELISKQLEIDNVLMRINLSAASVFVPGNEDWQLLLLEDILIV